MDYLSYKRRMRQRQKHPFLFRLLEFLKRLPLLASFRRPQKEFRVLPEGWKIGLLTDHEPQYLKADQYREHLVRLRTVQPVKAVPDEVGRVLYDELQMIDRYDGSIFLTKLGVMYLKNRGLV